jgi:hypothetical protein
MSKTGEAFATFLLQKSESDYGVGNQSLLSWSRRYYRNRGGYIPVSLPRRETKGKSSPQRNNQKCFEEINLIFLKLCVL